MQLDFFPSRTLTLYLAKLFVVRIVAVLFMLVLVLLALDLLSKTGDILAAPGNGQAEVLRYASLRLPHDVTERLFAVVVIEYVIQCAAQHCLDPAH